jgi:hypothetical protein
MQNKSIITRLMAVTGCILVWGPLFLPLIFGLVTWPRSGVFRFDYLMPAELFPVVLVGGGLLFGAALRARIQRRLIGAGLLAAIFFLAAGQALAVVSGLASGQTEAGWLLAVVMGSLGLYALADLIMGIGGVLLARTLFAKPTRLEM